VRAVAHRNAPPLYGAAADQDGEREPDETTEAENSDDLHTPLDGTLPVAPGNDNAPIARRERLGGLLNYYYRSAT
jgi:hypothetical protein